VDDLPQLVELWTAAHLPAAVLEKSFTDFQIVHDEIGKLVGAIGLQVEGRQGRVYAETFADFALSDSLRPELWKRLQTVAQNHGLFRVWTEEDAPWWKKDAGFAAPAEEISQKLPPAFGQPGSTWITLRLREEMADPDFLDKEMALFRETERANREALMERAKAIRVFGTALGALVFIFTMAVLFYMKSHGMFIHR
jgi:hypothetical protein